MGLVGPVRPVAPVALVAPVAPVRPHPPVRSPKRTGPISPGRPPRYIQDAGSPGPCPDRHGQRPASAGETGPPAQGF
eukprot:gene18539-biopygen23422